MADFLRSFFTFSTHHAGAQHWMIVVFSLLLLAISLIFSTLMMYRLVRDSRRLQVLPQDAPLTERLQLRDKIFGWITGMTMLLFVFAAAVSKIG